MWGIFRGAHYIGWGFLGGVYDPSTGVNSFPGIEILLAPLAMLSSHLGLSESFPPFFIAHPRRPLLLGPIELLLAATVLFPVDALAERFGVLPARRQSLLCVVVAVLAWPMAAIWGHAEDCIAITFALYSMLAIFDERWVRSGWLFGFALVFQPLVVMTLPLLIAVVAPGQATAHHRAFGRAFGRRRRDRVLERRRRCVPLDRPAADAAVDQPSDSLGFDRSACGRCDRIARWRRHASPIRRRAIRHLPIVGHAQSDLLVSGGAGRAVEALLAVLIGALCVAPAPDARRDCSGWSRPVSGCAASSRR